MAKKRTESRFTIDDVNELKAWFTEHMDELPETLEMNKYTKYLMLKKTVVWLIEVAEEHWEHPYFEGYIVRLQEIRRKVMGEEVL